MADNNNLNIIVKVVDQATKKLQEINKLVEKLGTTSTKTAEQAKKLTPKDFKRWDKASLKRSVLEQDQIAKESADKRIKYAQHNRENEQKHLKQLDADRLKNIQLIADSQKRQENNVYSFRTAMNRQFMRQYEASERKKEAEAKRTSNLIERGNDKAWKDQYKQLAQEKAAEITKAEAAAKEKARIKALNELKSKIISDETLKLGALEKTKLKFIKNEEGVEKFVVKRRQTLDHEKQLGQLKNKYLADQSLKLNELDKLKIKNAKSEIALEGLVARKKQKLEEDLLKQKSKTEKQTKKEQPKEIAKKSDLDFTQFNKTLFTTTAFLGTFYKMFTTLTAKLEEGAGLERLQNQYRRVFGTSGLQADIRNFTSTAVSEMDAMQAALNMGNAGVVHSQEEAADLIAKAATASKMANIDVSTGIREVTEALKNGSIANLEHLNILRTNDPVLKQEMSMLQKMTGIMSPAYMAQYRYNLIKRALTRHTKDHMHAEMDLMDIVTKMTSSFKVLSGTVGIFLGKAVSPLVLKVEDLVVNFTDFLTRVTKDKSVLEFTKNLMVIGSVVTGVVATLGTLRLGMLMLGFAGIGPFGVILTALTGIAVAMTDLKPQIADIGKLLKIVGSTFSGVTQLVSSFFLNADNFSKGVGTMDKKTADFLRTIKVGDSDLLSIVENISRTLVVTLQFINDVIDKIKSGITSLIESPMFKSLSENLFGDSEAWSRRWIDEGSKVRDFMISSAGIVAASWALNKLLPNIPGKTGLIGAGILGGVIGTAYKTATEIKPSEGEKLSNKDLLGMEKMGQKDISDLIKQKTQEKYLIDTGQNFNKVFNFLSQFDFTGLKDVQEQMSLGIGKEIEVLMQDLEQSKLIEKNLKQLIKSNENVITAIEKINEPITTSAATGTDAIAKIENGQFQTVPGGTWQNGQIQLTKMPDVVPTQGTAEEFTQMLRTSQKYANEQQKKIIEDGIKIAMLDTQFTAEELYNIYKKATDDSVLTKQTKPKMSAKTKTGCS